jgi:hypothetical protein
MQYKLWNQLDRLLGTSNGHAHWQDLLKAPRKDWQIIVSDDVLESTMGIVYNVALALTAWPA